jgi:hypothetical protein
MPVDSPGLAVRKPETRSRISNGSHILPGVDARSTWARRLKDLIALHTADLGGVEAISAAEASIIRRAACLTVELERLELVFATTDAKPEDLDLYQRMSNTLRRHLETTGLKRVPKNVTPTIESLAEHLSAEEPVE